MAEANATVESNGEEQKLSDIFLNGWNLFDELEVTELPFNSTEFQVYTEKKHIFQFTKYNKLLIVGQSKGRHGTL